MEPRAADVLTIAAGRRGHFLLESGHHGELWLELDALFTHPEQTGPLADRLAEAIRPYRVDAVCGPMLGGAFLAQLVAHRLRAEFWYTTRQAPADGAGGMYRVEYRLPAALVPRVRGSRVAMVDDVMSAGSALRGTCAALRANGAVPVAAGALLVLGSTGEGWFAGEGIPVEACMREEYPIWPPDRCPRCAEGVPLETAPA